MTKLERIVKELGLTPKFGLLKMLSVQTYTDEAQPVIEYVRNGWDADASEVKLTLNKDSLIIEDDGTGMNLEGLEKFLFIGESPRARQGKSERGRKYMGRWGVGNLSALTIGQGYKIQTIQEGQKITYDLDFKKLEQIEKKGKEFFNVKKKPKVSETKQANGTKIEIYGLNKTYTTKLNQLRAFLKKEIGKKMPLREEEFKVLLNGKEISHYIDQYIKSAKKCEIKFTVLDENKKKHQVKGWFKVADKALSAKDSGIYPVINKEITITNGHLYDSDSIPGFIDLKHRIYGEFEADFLANMLTLSRSRFKRHSLVDQIYSKINRYMVRLNKSFEKEKEKKIDERLEEVINKTSVKVGYVLSHVRTFSDEILPDTEERTNKVYQKSNKNTRKKKAPEKLDEVKPILLLGDKFNIAIYSGKEKGNYVSINERGREILVNKDHPEFLKAQSIGEETLENYITESVLKKLSVKAKKRSVDADKLYNSYIRAAGEF